MFVAGAMLVINANDGACPRYYTYNHHFDLIGGSLLFRLPTKILKALQYFGLYTPAGHTGTDPALTALVFHQYGEVDWSKTAIEHRFVSSDFSNGEVYRLREKVVQARKCVTDVDGSRRC